MTKQFAPLCMICDHTLFAPLFYVENTHGREKISQERFPVYFCSHCLTYQLPIVQNQTYYQKYYDSFDYYARERENLFSLKVQNFLNSISFFLRMLCIPSSRKKRRWLDVGAGDGSFLQKLPKKKFEAVGVEISVVGYEEMKKKGIFCHQGSFENVDFDKDKFDCVSFWHVLEHCNHPRLYIEKACHLLNEGGLLLIAVPCAKSFGFRWGKEAWFHFDAPRHVFWPTETTLFELTKGFPLRLEKKIFPWWEYPLDLWWSVKNLPFLKKWFVRFLYPLVKVCDKETMIFVFQKQVSAKGQGK